MTPVSTTTRDDRCCTAGDAAGRARYLDGERLRPEAAAILSRENRERIEVALALGWGTRRVVN